MRDEVEQVFLKVRSRTRNDLHLILPDHLRQAQPQLRRRHRTGQRDHHLSAAVEMPFVTLGRVDQRRGIKMPVMMLDKISDLVVHRY